MVNSNVQTPNDAQSQRLDTAGCLSPCLDLASFNTQTTQLLMLKENVFMFEY